MIFLINKKNQKTAFVLLINCFLITTQSLYAAELTSFDNTTDLTEETVTAQEPESSAQEPTSSSNELTNDELRNSLHEAFDDDDDDDHHDHDGHHHAEPDTDNEIYDKIHVINSINIRGNKKVPNEAIANRIPFRVGEQFNSVKTRQLIHNLYYELKRFRNVSVKGKILPNNKIDLYIFVEEKIPLKEVLFSGNKSLSEKDIKKKIDFSAIPAIDEEELKKYALDIKKMYIEKNYLDAEITPIMTLDEEGRASVTFNVKENQKSLVKRVQFRGNQKISSKVLKTKIFTREDWLFGFLDKAGTYQPDHIEADKHLIEQVYQSNGFLNAKVADVETVIDPTTKNITMIYHIQEGDQYIIKEVKAPGNELVSEQQLLSVIPIRPGQLYSRENIVEAMKGLELIWGQFGYIYANVEPSIEPDDETKTVSIGFYSDLGTKVKLNKLNIRGNKKTRDKVIRRRIVLDEGELITTQKMDSSKDNVEALGYFDPRDGVNWKTTRITEGLADLDLIVKEAKTGRAHIKLGYGGSPTDITSSAGGFSAGLEVADTNWLGSGLSINFNATLAKDEQSVVFNLTEPWLFDKPISAGFDFFHRRVSYDELSNAYPVNEKTTGTALSLGFVTGFRNQFLNDVFMRFSLGADSLRYDPGQPKTRISNQPLTVIEQYQCVLCKLFRPDTFITLTTFLGQDRKNHPMHPSRGYKWLATSKVALPGFNKNVGFYKFDFDISWYTPLIGERDLVLHLQSYFGITTQLGNRTIPYRELFHIGGPASVRGFLFGQIGPQFVVDGRSDSIGGNKGLFVKAELIFPIRPDFSMKGVIFYDGGTGWDNPYANCITTRGLLRNNTFSYRHSVGFGVRLLQPAPMSIDWGFKLDPKKGETASEIHFGMTYDW